MPRPRRRPPVTLPPRARRRRPRAAGPRPRGRSRRRGTPRRHPNRWTPDGARSGRSVSHPAPRCRKRRSIRPTRPARGDERRVRAAIALPLHPMPPGPPSRGHWPVPARRAGLCDRTSQARPGRRAPVEAWSPASLQAEWRGCRDLVTRARQASGVRVAWRVANWHGRGSRQEGRSESLGSSPAALRLESARCHARWPYGPRVRSRIVGVGGRGRCPRRSARGRRGSPRRWRPQPGRGTLLQSSSEDGPKMTPVRQRGDGAQ